jgi:hypothetical protein
MNLKANAINIRTIPTFAINLSKKKFLKKKKSTPTITTINNTITIIIRDVEFINVFYGYCLI